MPEDTSRFWVVWNPERKAPMVRHESLLRANDEAKRLCAKHPGERFYVMEAGIVVTAKPAEPHMQLLE